MANINTGRVLLAGLVAGLIVNISEGILNGVVLAEDWKQAMAALHLPEMGATEIAVFNIMGFLSGILSIWLYAAVLPRLGSGPKTAAVVALFVWTFGYLFAMAAPLMAGMFPAKLVCLSLIWGLVEMLIALMVGTKLYKESAA
jgi:hypothetical protein